MEVSGNVSPLDGGRGRINAGLLPGGHMLSSEISEAGKKSGAAPAQNAGSRSKFPREDLVRVMVI
jgi:hypothetical protein